MKFQEVVDYQADLAVLNGAEKPCECLTTEVRSRMIRGGSQQFVKQCLNCGESVGNPVKQIGTAKPFDERLRNTYRERRELEREALRTKESDLWWGKYKRYMASDEWRAIRGKVMQRDKNVCQGCLVASADEVHHTTYKNFGHEFAYELISLCKPCHERMHE